MYKIYLSYLKAPRISWFWFEISFWNQVKLMYSFMNIWYWAAWTISTGDFLTSAYIPSHGFTHLSYGILIFVTHGPLILSHKSIYVCRYSMFNWWYVIYTISKSTKHINKCHLLFIICVILQTKWQARTFCCQCLQVFFGDTIFKT